MLVCCDKTAVSIELGAIEIVREACIEKGGKSIEGFTIRIAGKRIARLSTQQLAEDAFDEIIEAYAAGKKVVHIVSK